MVDHGGSSSSNSRSHHGGPWYDTARVERTVTRKFVCSHLLPGEIENLDLPLAFGDGLTDCTYWDWIQDKAKRLFLILVDLGVPDQIFGVVDDSWEDADLPIPLDHIDRLALTATRDAKFDAKFYARQFFYLVRHLGKDEHLDYRADELVPIHVVEKRLTTHHDHAVDKVELPGFPGTILCRRRFALGDQSDCLSEEDFMSQIDLLKSLQNDHMFSYWASYTHQGYGYILSTPVSEYKLGSFLSNNQFGSLKNLDKWTRRRMALDWIHCLVDTLGFIHSRGLFLGGIKPSSIFLTHDHHIFFPDAGGGLGHLCPDVHQHNAKNNSFDKESYDYAAPEQWFKPTKSAPTIRRHNHLPENNSFSISRGGHHSDHISPTVTNHPQPPTINPQAADVFSLGCILLDLLSHGLLYNHKSKRSSSAFAAHRAAKHKTAGRGGAIPDSSFHKNLGQVESWMAGMAHDAAKKDKEGADGLRYYRAVAPLLHVVEKMLAVQSSERPSAVQVQSWVYSILTEIAGIAEPHCVHKYNINDPTARHSTLSSSADSSSSGERVLTMTAFLESESTIPDDEEIAVAQGSSGNACKRSSRVFDFVSSRTHRRHPSDQSSSGSRGSDREGGGGGWEMGSGLKAIQNLRISGKKMTTPRAWQSTSSQNTGSVVSSES